jgi:hypothetical protein
MTNAGRIGINTTNPGAPLHIYNANSTGNDPTASHLDCFNPTNSAGQSSIISSRIGGLLAGNTYYSMDVSGNWGFSMGMAAATGRLQFRNAWNFTGTEVMTLANAGNVGIGSTNPGYKLDVNGDLNVAGNYWWRPGTNFFLPGTANDQEWSFDIQNNGKTGLLWHVWSDAVGSVLRAKGDTGYVTVPQRFGVGTDTPQTVLHVATGSPNIRIEAVSSGDPRTEYYQDGLFKGCTAYSRGGSYMYYQNSAEDKMRFYDGAGGAVVLQPTGGSVGIGISPSFKFHVDATTSTGVSTFLQASGMGNNTTTSLVIGKAGSLRNSGTILWNHVADNVTQNFLGLGFWGTDNLLNIAGTARVGIGITNPGAVLDVVGSFRTSTSMTFSLGAGGGVRYVQVDNNGNVLYASSDERLKSNITPISYGLNTVLQLNPVTFNWKDSSVGGPFTDMGFIAQEVEPLIPEVVRVDANGTYSLNLPNMNAVLTKAIQELSAKNTTLEETVNSQAATIGSLETKLQTAQNDIDLLESRLAAIEALISTNMSADTGSAPTGTRADALLSQV